MKSYFILANLCLRILASPICGAGVENTVIDSEVYTATVSAVSFRPEFKVLDVEVLPIRKDGNMAESMFSPPSRSICVLEKCADWFLRSHSGASMATPFARAISPITPHYVTPGQHHADRIRPHTPPPGDSEALAMELQQRAENALGLALHYARIGSHPQALAKARRAIAALSRACVETAGAQ